MVTTKGIIKSIDSNGNTCIVRVPQLESAGIQDEIETTATFSIQPGTHSGYSIGDVVYITFENNSYEKAVVLGKLYINAATENTNTGGINCGTLKVSKSAILPLDTKIAYGGSSGTIAKVDGGYEDYKSMSDIIKGLQKTTATTNDLKVQVLNTGEGLTTRVADLVKDNISGVVSTLQSEITQTAKEISNKVSINTIDSRGTSSSEGLGWNLTVDNWKLTKYKDDTEKDILVADKDGLKINGRVEATSGIIGAEGKAFHIADQDVGSVFKDMNPGEEPPEYKIVGSAQGWDKTINYGELGKRDSVIMSAGLKDVDNQFSIGSIEDSKGQTWAFVAGQNFGVTTSGQIFAEGADIHGNIKANGLLIRDTDNNVVLEADGEKHTVQIAGFHVDKDTFEGGDSINYAKIYTPTVTTSKYKITGYDWEVNASGQQVYTDQQEYILLDYIESTNEGEQWIDLHMAPNGFVDTNKQIPKDIALEAEISVVDCAEIDMSQSVPTTETISSFAGYTDKTGTNVQVEYLIFGRDQNPDTERDRFLTGFSYCTNYRTFDKTKYYLPYYHKATKKEKDEDGLYGNVYNKFKFRSTMANVSPSNATFKPLFESGKDYDSDSGKHAWGNMGQTIAVEESDTTGAKIWKTLVEENNTTGSISTNFATIHLFCDAELGSGSPRVTNNYSSCRLYYLDAYELKTTKPNNPEDLYHEKIHHFVPAMRVKDGMCGVIDLVSVGVIETRIFYPNGNTKSNFDYKLKENSIELENVFSVGNANEYAAPFKVTNTGSLIAKNVEVKGTINADYLIANNYGQIGGFEIDNNSLSTKDWTDKRNKAIVLFSNLADEDIEVTYKDPASGEVSGSDKRKDWSIIAGEHFGITRDGTVYAANLKAFGTSSFTGTLESTGNFHSSGTIISGDKNKTKDYIELANGKLTATGNIISKGKIISGDELSVDDYIELDDGTLTASGDIISYRTITSSGNIVSHGNITSDGNIISTGTIISGDKDDKYIELTNGDLIASGILSCNGTLKSDNGQIDVEGGLTFRPDWDPGTKEDPHRYKPIISPPRYEMTQQIGDKTDTRVVFPVNVMFAGLALVPANTWAKLRLPEELNNLSVTAASISARMAYVAFPDPGSKGGTEKVLARANYWFVSFGYKDPDGRNVVWLGNGLPKGTTTSDQDLASFIITLTDWPSNE